MKLTEAEVVKVLATLVTRAPASPGSEGGHGSVGRLTRPSAKGRLEVVEVAGGKPLLLPLLRFELRSFSVSAAAAASPLQSLYSRLTASFTAALAAAVSPATVSPAACSTFSWWILVFLCRFRSELVWKPFAHREQKCGLSPVWVYRCFRR